MEEAYGGYGREAPAKTRLQSVFARFSNENRRRKERKAGLYPSSQGPNF